MDTVITVAALKSRIGDFALPKGILLLGLIKGARGIGREAAALHTGFEYVQVGEQGHELFFGEQVGGPGRLFGALAGGQSQQQRGQQQGLAVAAE